MADVVKGRVQSAEELKGRGALGQASGVAWELTDEFARRFERLPGRSQRAVEAALAAFAALPVGADAYREGSGGDLRIHSVAAGNQGPEVHCLSWSAEGRATFTVERSDSGTLVTWLAVGPHGANARADHRR